MSTDLLYGLDIETDTTVDGLDPGVAPVVAVALATAAGTTVFTGDEADLLRAVDAAVADLAPGVLVTWNGGAFDLPFLADRARACGVTLGLELGTDGGASWGEHGHLDGYCVYRADVGSGLGLSCGLKSMARLVGMAPVEVDRADIMGLSAEELHAYVSSDAELARSLVMRRWPACAPAVRRPPAAGRPPEPVSSC